MTQTDQDFTFYVGEDKDIVFTDVNGTNLTGAAITWIMAESKVSTAVLITKTVAGGGITLTNPAAGIYTVHLDPVDSTNLDHGVYYHEAMITLGGVVSKAVIGSATLRPNVIQGI